ncbi:MAG: metal-dependent hydrolase [Woeseiaceae bacterium]|nr:metal-dependent hydrolase [Woeseiaceae bacterium]
MTALPQSMSPDGLAFGPRRKSFDLESALAGDWHGGSAFVTAWFNAMSMLFPLGEKFFIDSVRHYIDDIDDPKLLDEIAAFQAQEATHRRQHQRYNELLCKLRGYDLERIERPERERIAWAYRELSARRRLAGTTASEHLTAILANEMLTRPEPMAGADPAVAELWMWHGIEETEHKAVAFDVHVAVGGTVGERRRALILNTFFFLKDTMRNLCIMLQQAGKLWSLREWASGFHYLFVRPGVLRRISIPWLRFLRKDFHPWQHDNRYLIDDWQRRVDAEASSPVQTH